MLDPGQRDYLRKLTRGFDGDRLERVYDDFINKTFEDLIELAQSERRDMEKAGIEGIRQDEHRKGSSRTYRMAPPTPSSAASPFGFKEDQTGRGRTSLSGTFTFKC